MRRKWSWRHVAAAMLMAAALTGSARAAWPPSEFRNLKVLPADSDLKRVLDTMSDFTRALGVRCAHCHVGEAGQPLSTYDFASDDKATKQKAREMMRMVNDLNERFLPSLESRAEPAVQVECATCHRGAPVPRMLEDVLTRTYDTAGIDSTLAQYRALHEQHYGRFTYDFSEVPLLFVGAKAMADGHPGDAARILGLNVEEHPKSELAKNRHASAAILAAFLEGGRERGEREWRRLRTAYGPDAFSEEILNRVGYRLLGDGQVEDAIAAFRLNVETYPESANVYDSLGEAYMAQGDRERAVRNYRKVLEIDPANAHAKEQLNALGVEVK